MTCRPIWEGGHSNLQRLGTISRTLLRRYATSAKYIDWELAAFQDTPGSLYFGPDAVRILSFHDFAGRPERLYSLLEELNQSPAEMNQNRLDGWHDPRES